ncbi:hypothetical protein ACNKHO_03735 [Shigella flexneri]
MNQILPSMGYRTLYIQPNVTWQRDMRHHGRYTALLENAFWQIDSMTMDVRLRDKDGDLLPGTGDRRERRRR